MSASIEATRRLVRHHKEGLIDNASVIISALAVMIAAFSLLFGGVSLYAVHVANERTAELSSSIDVYRIRAAKMDAWLKAHGVPTEKVYD